MNIYEKEIYSNLILTMNIYEKEIYSNLILTIEHFTFYKKNIYIYVYNLGI